MTSIAPDVLAFSKRTKLLQLCPKRRW